MMRPAVTSLRASACRPIARRRAMPAALKAAFAQTPTRHYAVHNPGAPNLQVFNEHTKILQKERAASHPERSRQVDYLRDEVAKRIAERLLDINRPFPKILDLGANACNLSRILTTPNLDPLSPNAPPVATTRGIQTVVSLESAPTLLHRDDGLPFNNENLTIERQVVPSLETLPFGPNTFDAVLSSLSMHWVNDLPSLLAQINHILKPDAPFIAALFGGDTLYELRTSLQLASMERRGGMGVHTSPLADVKDMGALLNRAGFKMLTVDVDDIIVDYPDVFALMADLQDMGESNAVLGREMGPIDRDVLLGCQPVYKELHGDGQEGIPATFRMIYLIGWKEGPNQSKPLERGSGTVSMKDILEGKVEIK